MRRTNPAGSESAVPKNPDDYLAAVPEPARGTLTKIRAVIRSTVPPEATETISYGMPMFKYKGMVAGYAAFTSHCSLFPGAAAIEAFKAELKQFKISKGTIQFPMDKPLPASLVKKLVKATIAQNENREKNKSKKKR